MEKLADFVMAWHDEEYDNTSDTASDRLSSAGSMLTGENRDCRPPAGSVNNDVMGPAQWEQVEQDLKEPSAPFRKNFHDIKPGGRLKNQRGSPHPGKNCPGPSSEEGRWASIAATRRKGNPCLI